MAERFEVKHVPLTQEDYDRFHRNAPAALARRGWSGLMEQTSAALQTICFGALPITGLVWLGWSATEMLLFLLVGLWIGIVCDAAKVLALRRRAESFVAAKYDDWHVWVVVSALRKGQKNAPEQHLRAAWDPMGGVFIDFAMGGVSTVVIVIMLTVEAGLGWDALETPGVMLGVVAFALLRVASTVWEILHHRATDREREISPALLTEEQRVKRAQSDRPVKAAVGLRGVGLFLLMFLTVYLTDSGQDLDVDVAWMTMIVVNGAVVLYGAMSLLTWPLLIRETRWLRQYLQGRQQGDQKKRKRKNAT